MTKRTLDIGNLANELEGSKYFAHKKEEKEAEKKRTGVQVNSSTPVQVNGRTGVRKKELIGAKTVRVPFNIFEEHVAQIDWYINEKKGSSKRSYNKSLFVRDLLDKFFAREKKSGRMPDLKTEDPKNKSVQ